MQTLYVMDTESGDETILGRYAETVEDVVSYLRPDGGLGFAPVDCVALVRVTLPRFGPFRVEVLDEPRSAQYWKRDELHPDGRERPSEAAMREADHE